MVKVEEIVDAEKTKSYGNSPYASTSSSRTSSSASLSSVASSDVDDDLENESFSARLAALADIIPPTTRHAISTRIKNAAGFVKKGTQTLGNVAWVLTTSALLVGLPLALVLEDEAKIVQAEQELIAQQQGQQMLAQPSGFPGAPPAQPQGIVPPGF